MKILVTAGATIAPIDQVRGITNIFRGRTGTTIAVRLAVNGWERLQTQPGPWERTEVTLLTSSPRLAHDALAAEDDGSWGWLGVRRDLRIEPYHTYNDLAALLEHEVRSSAYDVVIHSAAVSDYNVAALHTRDADGRLTELEATGKVGSHHGHLFLELVPTEKLLEKIKGSWGFTGTLVQFKLEVGISDDELYARARRSLDRSGGDIVVANCLEWARERATIIDRRGTATSVSRGELAGTLERMIKERKEAP